MRRYLSKRRKSSEVSPPYSEIDKEEVIPNADQVLSIKPIGLPDDAPGFSYDWLHNDHLKKIKANKSKREDEFNLESLPGKSAESAWNFLNQDADEEEVEIEKRQPPKANVIPKQEKPPMVSKNSELPVDEKVKELKIEKSHASTHLVGPFPPEWNQKQLQEKEKRPVVENTKDKPKFKFNKEYMTGLKNSEDKLKSKDKKPHITGNEKIEDEPKLNDKKPQVADAEDFKDKPNKQKLDNHEEEEDKPKFKDKKPYKPEPEVENLKDKPNVKDDKDKLQVSGSKDFLRLNIFNPLVKSQLVLPRESFLQNDEKLNDFERKPKKGRDGKSHHHRHHHHHKHHNKSLPDKKASKPARSKSLPRSKSKIKQDMETAGTKESKPSNEEEESSDDTELEELFKSKNLSRPKTRRKVDYILSRAEKKNNNRIKRNSYAPLLLREKERKGKAVSEPFNLEPQENIFIPKPPNCTTISVKRQNGVSYNNNIKVINIRRMPNISVLPPMCCPISNSCNVVQQQQPQLLGSRPFQSMRSLLSRNSGRFW